MSRLIFNAVLGGTTTLESTNSVDTFLITVPAENGTLLLKDPSGDATFRNLTLTGAVLAGAWNGSTITVPYGGTGAVTLTGYVKGNGTSAMTASATIPNTDITGLGTMSTQNASAVTITGGTINNTTLGATTPAAGVFTTLRFNSTLSANGATGTAGQVLTSNGASAPTWQTASVGTVTSVDGSGGTTGLTLTGGPITSSGTLTLGGTLAVANGGTGVTALGTGVVTALGVNIGTAGSFVVNGGALGTPSSGTVTNLTGTASININGTVGATTPTTVVATQVDITAQGDLRLQDTTGGEYVALQAPGTLASSYTLTLPVDDGTAGQALITDGSGVLSWSSAASGDVYGPASATDNAVARYDGTTGKIIQNSAVTIGDDGATVIAANSLDSALRITQIGAGAGSNALLVEDSANPDATPFVVSNNGRVFIGYTSSMGEGGLQLKDTTQAMYTYSADAFVNSYFNFYKSRSTTPGVFSVVQSGDELGSLYFRGDNGTAFNAGASITSAVDGTPGTNDMPGRLVFSTTADGASSPTERMRIDAAGNVGVGTTAQAFEKLVLAGTFPSGSANTRANVVRGTIPSSTTGLFNGFRTEPVTQAASFTLTAMTHFSANQGTLGAGSAVTNQYGFIAESSLTGATNNYGFLGNIASGTGRWNFYAAGTASNFFEGSVSIGTTTTSGKLNVTGGTIEFDPGNGADSTRAFNFNITGTNFGKILIPVGSGGAMAFWTGSAAAERMRIGSTGTISLGAAPGSESLRVTPVASAVNYVEVLGAAASGTPSFISTGSDTNVNSLIGTKGAGVILFRTGGGVNDQFRITHTASAVNYLAVTGAAASGTPILTAAGTDANINIAYAAKGTGFHFFQTGGGNQFVVSNTASAVNYLQVTGGTTGNAPILLAAGSDANVNFTMQTKGTGSYYIYGAGAYFYNNSSAPQFAVVSTTSAVNYLQVTGGATGSAATISAQGSDTNIDLALTPKGTGNVRFGTHTASSDVAISGYITIKDSAGNTRKLAVIS